MQVVVFTGGGTGGHVYPGLAVVQALAQRGDFRIVWIGSRDGMERKIVEDWGLEYLGISSGKLRRYLSLKNFTDLFRILSGYFQSRKILKKLRPAFVFSKGGFVSVPPVRAAKSLKIPVFSHESDLDPGLATKLNLGCSLKTFLPYHDSLSFFPVNHRDRLVVTGNPVRREIFAGDGGWIRRRWSVPQGIPVVLVMGGSLGARQVNELVRDNLSRWQGRYFVVHQTGKEWEPLPETPWYTSAPFFKDEVPHLYAGADLLVGRAGAGTLWEAAAARLPMVLVPLTEGSRGDQVRNARLFARTGAASVLEGAVQAGDLDKAVEEILQNPQARQKASQALETLGADLTAGRIVDQMALALPSVFGQNGRS